MVDFKRALELWKQRGKPELTEEHIEGIFMAIDAKKLSMLSAMWKKVQPIQPSFTNVPDADYVADLKELKLAEAKKSGRLQVETTLEIVDGEFEGKTVKKFDGVEEETGMGYFKNTCEIIGLDLPPNLSLWQQKFDEFIAGNTVDLYDITVKTNDKYANVYINGVSDLIKGDEVAEGAVEVVEEEAAVAEEVVEEEIVEEQQVVVPTRRVQTVQQVAKPKVNAQPVRAAQPVRRTVVAQPQPQRRIISTRK